ncbi:hypothetical protein [Wenzhouxiangella marina]|uniref:Uncharacterized protein n=1 Tax=Wenzhouxiangella marina TaxID=1579979 RepID=A0A0K0XZ77_9GAMM|nr:hypothetical protein [Wenzhouxiangella marina]AKS42989.1 hypothetical protein WM2015_2631 [Wenzhouxiangella marina]MBB6087328.1 hypothetical protein [Wenzhouxiangella marina]
MSSISFYEKSAWGTLLALSVLGAFYFRAVYGLWEADALVAPAVTGLAIGFTIVQVIVLVVFHTLIAIIDRPGDEDERDRLIAWRAGSLSGLILGLGVFSVIFMMLAGAWLNRPVLLSPMVVVNLLLAALLLAELVDLAARIVFYRRGV